MSDLVDRARWLTSGKREVSQRYPWDEIISPLQECLMDCADHIEALEREVKDLKGDLNIANLRLKARRSTNE